MPQESGLLSNQWQATLKMRLPTFWTKQLVDLMQQTQTAHAIPSQVRVRRRKRARTTTIPNNNHQQKISLVRVSPRNRAKVKRLGRIQIHMKVVRHTTAKELKQGRRNLASASKRKLEISTLRLNGKRPRMIEKLSKMNLAGLTRT